ncbi:MAG: excinuclease ABC subunit UvrC [Alphaproteobacteria bacterium]|nr:excinuclease ABC subunit UvrC [Alphaproteobacteria bacterium]
MNLLPPSLSLGVKRIKETVRTLPALPGVYRMINAGGKILYIGKAKNLKRRVLSYALANKLTNRLQRMVSEIHRIEVLVTHTETEALLLECNLIKKHQPPFNILLKDDKSFPYILITKDHPFPRITKHRGPQDIKGDYFGPFANIAAVDETILTLQRLFQIRNCQDSYFAQRHRPCLQYHIKRCTAPCVQKISVETYQESITHAKDFLLGKADLVQRQLADRMNQASEALQFEQAALYRDKIKLLTLIQSHQRINVSDIKDADIVAIVQIGGLTCAQIFFFRNGCNFGTESFFLTNGGGESVEQSLAAFLGQFYQNRPPAPVVLLSAEPTELDLIKDALRERHTQSTHWEIPKQGIKKQLVDHASSNAQGTIERKQAESLSFKRLFHQLSTIFDLPKIPERIEVYDNSHLQGKNAYGVMIVANQQGFDKKSYRKFAIKGECGEKGDDYGMMREVLGRRLRAIDDSQRPDLLLIDGGQGQLTAVLDVMVDLGIDVPVVAIAKGPDRNAGKERFFMRGRDPFSLEENSHVLYFLQRLRDESHRFAIGTHRQKREKNLSKSTLDDIPGIGKTRKKKLLHHFGSAQGVSKAGLKDLQLVEGIHEQIALKIYNFFHAQ